MSVVVVAACGPTAGTSVMQADGTRGGGASSTDFGNEAGETDSGTSGAVADNDSGSGSGSTADTGLEDSSSGSGSSSTGPEPPLQCSCGDDEICVEVDSGCGFPPTSRLECVPRPDSCVAGEALCGQFWCAVEVCGFPSCGPPCTNTEAQLVCAAGANLVCSPYAQTSCGDDKCVPVDVDDNGDYEGAQCAVSGVIVAGEPCVPPSVFDDEPDPCDATSVCVPDRVGARTGVCRTLCTGTYDAPICPLDTECAASEESDFFAVCLPA